MHSWRAETGKFTICGCTRFAWRFRGARRISGKLKLQVLDVFNRIAPARRTKYTTWKACLSFILKPSPPCRRVCTSSRESELSRLSGYLLARISSALSAIPTDSSEFCKREQKRVSAPFDVMDWAWIRMNLNEVGSHELYVFGFHSVLIGSLRWRKLDLLSLVTDARPERPSRVPFGLLWNVRLNLSGFRWRWIQIRMNLDKILHFSIDQIECVCEFNLVLIRRSEFLTRYDGIQETLTHSYSPSLIRISGILFCYRISRKSQTLRETVNVQERRNKKRKEFSKFQRCNRKLKCFSYRAKLATEASWQMIDCLILQQITESSERGSENQPLSQNHPWHIWKSRRSNRSCRLTPVANSPRSPT